MASGVKVHILYQGSTACGMWWGNTPKGDVWVAPWEWADLDKLTKGEDVTPCPQCAEAYHNESSKCRMQWGDVLGH